MSCALVPAHKRPHMNEKGAERPSHGEKGPT